MVSVAASSARAPLLFQEQEQSVVAARRERVRQCRAGPRSASISALIGPKLTDELAAHLERRGLLAMPPDKAAPLFASRGVRGWCYPRVIAMFRCSSTYLGHLDIRSTQRYLRMRPELVEAANQRFALYAIGGDHEG